MGVEVEVFVNPDAFRPNPPRGHITFFPQLQIINRVLNAVGLPSYQGPRGGVHLCLRLGSYSTLTTLMKHVADLALGPRPSQQPFHEYLVNGYAEIYGDADPLFQHIALHRDCDGYFVPIDFPRVLDGGEELTGRYLGSAVRVKAECELLAELHGYPLLRDPIPEELPGWPSHEGVWNLLYHIGSTNHEWCEANNDWDMMTCAKLHYAASYAIRTQGLMMFS